MEETSHIYVTKRHIYPQKIGVKQGEAGVTSIRFEMDEYLLDDVNLAEYQAYAVTSLNGHVDITELQMEMKDNKLNLIWGLGEYTLRYSGNLAYQIVFKEKGAPDGNNSAVFKTYQAILQISESVDADSKVVADYPTIFKQWLDRISVLSGEINEPIVFMPVGQPIPPENRTSGTIYYQWFEIPTTRATHATGVVDLGNRPYADAGLYINNKHIYVDNTPDVAFVVDSSIWVNAINNANCGVTATDISSGGNVIIRLTALAAGTEGNEIKLELGVAQYGAGNGLTNPCNGSISGATLSGASDPQTGVSKPTGRFEDANGNVLCYQRATHIENANLNELLEVGEYVCTGSMTNNPVEGNTYCIVRAVDSTDTTRITQECLCVDETKNEVRNFVRTLISSTNAGEWQELVNKGVIEANKVLVSDNKGNVISHPSVDSTELNGLDGYNTGNGTIESRFLSVEAGLAGEIKWFAGKTVPQGYLLCNGSNVSRTTYAKLFAAIGTTWGNGDGSTTFTLPNLIDRVQWGGTTAGAYKDAGLPNITGNLNGILNGDSSADGAFKKGDTYSGVNGGGDYRPRAKVSFNASRSSAIYGKSSTVQPPAAVMMPIIRY